MTRRFAVVRAIALLGCVYCVTTYGSAQETASPKHGESGRGKDEAAAQDSDEAKKWLQRLETQKKELPALVNFLKSKGIDLRSVKTDGRGNGLIDHRFAVGPDYDKGYQVGFSYRPDVTEDYVAPIALPYAIHANWILWRIHAPDVSWNKVVGAFKEYRGTAKIH